MHENEAARSRQLPFPHLQAKQGVGSSVKRRPGRRPARRRRLCADAGMTQAGGANALLGFILVTPPLPLPALLTYILQHPGYITGQGC